LCFIILELSDNLSSLGMPGTRQTLYLSGEENVSRMKSSIVKINFHV